MDKRKLIVGNWKMNGSLSALAELDGIAATARAHPAVEVAVCPPFTLIAAADIKSVDSAPSAMPELAAVVLSKSEIRNLVATVASLKTPAQPAKKTLRALQQLDAE